MLYEVTLFQSYAGQSCINRFNYVSGGTPASVSGSFALVSAMGGIPPTLTPGQFPTGSLMEVIRTAQVTGVTFVALLAKAIYSVTDFYELPYVPPVTGASGGQGLSPVSAYGLRTNRVRTDIRRGTKRFVGVDEQANSEGGVLDATGATFVNNIAEAMSEVLEYDDEGNTITFTPVVVGKQPYIPEGSTRTAYRYYPTEAEQDEHLAEGVLWQGYPNIRSQTSRQYGRGQ